MSAVASPAVTVKPLRETDLDAVVAIDAAIEGRSRRLYFERRLAAALKQPEQHVQFAAADGDALVGFILARRVHGEFGRVRPGLRIEAVGVTPARRGLGVGRALIEALQGWARRHGAVELRTAAEWNQHAMLRWFDACGFRLDPGLIVDCAVGAYRQAERDDALELAGGAGREIDYGAPENNDFERVQRARCDVRPMQPQDLPQIVRIDAQITGRQREAYIAARLAEALDDAAIRVSLTARLEDAIVGCLMARADIGDFGRTEPVAVLDTIDVDPAYAHRGVGQALLARLFADLGALHVDRVETVVAPDHLGLLAFLHDAGFRPSQRLAFVRRLD